MSYIIEDITTKQVNTKFGMKPAYNIVANGERFNYGFKKPTFNISDEVDFQFTESTYGKNVDLASVRMINKGTAPATTPTPEVKRAPSGGGSFAAKVFPIPPLHGDRAIVRQNSVTNATKIVCETKLAKCTSVEEIAVEVIKVARMLEAYSCGDIDAEMAQSIANVKVD